MCLSPEKWMRKRNEWMSWRRYCDMKRMGFPLLSNQEWDVFSLEKVKGA